MGERLRMCFLTAAIALLGFSAWGGEAVFWDFTKGARLWTGNAKVANLRATDEGMEFDCTGEDPWITAPAADFASEGVARLSFRMRSTGDAAGQFFFGPNIDPGKSVRLHVRADGEWHDYAVMVPRALGKGRTIRLDPSNGPGRVTIAWFRAESLAPPPRFEGAAPGHPVARGVKTVAISSGGITVKHPAKQWGGFTVEVDGVEMAAAQDKERVAYLENGEVFWLELATAEVTATVRDEMAGRLMVAGKIQDAGGASWRFERRFSFRGRTIEVAYQVRCDRERDVVYLPCLVLFPGLGSFGERKTQGLFAGVEYLADEPSSSEAEIRGPNAVRRVPDPLKITMPLMAVAHKERYVGLVWDMSDPLSAVFDSPDRIYGSGAHVMGLVAPGFEGHRFENNLTAYRPLKLKADSPFEVKAQIIAGRGAAVVSAVEHYLETRSGLPGVPVEEEDFESAVDLLARGWVDSASYHEGLWRHAVWGDKFGPTRAPDAAAYLVWLKDYIKDPELADRVESAISLGIQKVGEGRPFTHGISHVRIPNLHLLFGRVETYLDFRVEEAHRLLRGFDEKGIRRYKQAPGKPDYASTHFADHANGLAGRYAATILEAAALTGDEEIEREGLELLDKLTLLYKGTVPRGAQSWEMPLHCPDILASAYMIQPYVLGYELTGKRKYLDEARYWAWTGVPFVYLRRPADGPIGEYATTAVLGATNWKAPFWIGQPVQWCGLVYAAMLHRLEPHDPSGPWRRIARGVTAAGLQMTWPVGDAERQGLLPDFLHLREQHRDGPAIAPGTVQASLPELFGKGKQYNFKRLQNSGWLIHAPCKIPSVKESESKVSLDLDGVGSSSYYVVVARVKKSPASVRLESKNPSNKVLERRYSAEKQLLVVRLSGGGKLIFGK